MNLKFKEAGYVVKVLKDPIEIEKAQKLRYKVFCKELKWLLPDMSDNDNNIGIEKDRFDSCSVHFGVFNNKNLLGCIRITVPTNSDPLLIQSDFRESLKDDKLEIDKRESIEISRLAVDYNSLHSKRKKSFKKTEKKEKIVWCLYKIIYKWSVKNKKRFWYMVVNEDYFKRLKQFFPIEKLGPGKEYQKGILTIPIKLDLRKGEKKLEGTNRELYEWFVN